MNFFVAILLMGGLFFFGAYSFMMCLLWAIMGAVDVAFTEASVGAGVSTVLKKRLDIRTEQFRQAIKNHPDMRCSFRSRK